MREGNEWNPQLAWAYIDRGRVTEPWLGFVRSILATSQHGQKALDLRFGAQQRP